MDRQTYKILIVDDFKSQRSVIKMHLSDYKTEIFEATNGNDALRILEQHQIDLVFTDLEMPDMDGINLVEIIRKNPKLIKLPVIMISSLKSGMPKAKRAGITGWLDKPFDKSDLISVFEQTLSVTNDSHHYTMLIIDDFEPQREVWGQTLKMENFNIALASNAQEGLNTMRSQKIDVVLTDYHMPRVDGIIFAKKVKSMPEFKHIPIFMFTNRNDYKQLEPFDGVEKVFHKTENPLLIKSAIRRSLGIGVTKSV